MTYKKPVGILALLLALLLACSSMTAFATNVEEFTYGDYAAWTQTRMETLYGDLMATTTIEEVWPLTEPITDVAFEKFLSALTAEEREALEAHLKSLEPELELYNIVNYTNAAPFRDPVAGKAGRMAMPAVKTTSDEDNGIVLGKKVRQKDADTYTVTLEAHTTGTVSSVVENIPADIVLVLDQSGSMSERYGFSHDQEYGYMWEESLWFWKYKRYGFSDNVQKYIKMPDGNYQEVQKVNNPDDNGFFYYRYGSNNRVYPELTANLEAQVGSQRKHNYPVVPFYTRSEITKLSALKSAVSSFTSAVANKAITDNVNHRVAIVGFANGGGSYDYGNTEVFVGGSQYKFPSAGSNHYKNALQGMNTDTGRSNIESSIDELSASGGTHTDLGLVMANRVFAANPVQSGERRNRVIIVFTDGVPGDYGFDSSVASAAVAEAQTAKNGGATVYAVGIFNGADAASAGSSSGTETEKANRFMQQMSSNNGTPRSPSYYLSAGDANALNNVFTQIVSQIEKPTIPMGAQAKIKDIITPYFVPDGTTLQLYTSDYLKDGNWAVPVPAESSISARLAGDTVLVDGFDYDLNFISEVGRGSGGSFYGRKLIVEFEISVRDGFLGGNDVPTNDYPNSGLYDKGGQCLESFAEPKVDVPIPDVTVTCADKNIYLLGGLTNEQMLEGVVMRIGTVDYDPQRTASDQFEEWQYKFVDIDCVLPTPLMGMVEDTQYNMTLSVKPKGESTGKSATGSGTVRVYKPELTFRDSEVDYLALAPAQTDYQAKNHVSTSWKHNGVASTSVTIYGTAPTLDLTYAPKTGIENSKVTSKTFVPVNADVKIGSTNVNAYTTFVHELHGCAEWKDGQMGDAKFLLHVVNVTGKLTITKSGASSLDAGQAFLFNIKGEGVDLTVTILGNNSVTVVDLPAGNYTVTEVSDWSWRYAAQSAQGANVAGGNTASVSFSNVRDNGKWLSGDDSKNNKFD